MSKIQGFISDIERVVKKIDDNTATNSDYSTFQEMMELIGVETKDIKDALSDNGFDGWAEYYQERRKPVEQQDVKAIKSVIGAVKGIADAVIQVLKKEDKELA